MAISSDKKRLFVDKENNKGISLHEIATCLQDYRLNSRGEVDLGMMCTSPQINKWAKHKPVRFNSKFTTENSWKANDGWCGFNLANAKISSTTDVTNIALKYSHDMSNGWDYETPRGAVNGEFFRIHDFDGYNAEVTAFVTGYTTDSVKAQDDGDFEVAFRISEPDNENADYISYKDLNFQDYYLGVALVNQDSGEVIRLTNETKIVDDDATGMRVFLEANQIPVGNYKIYPFFSSVIVKVADSNKAANVYTMPNCSSFDIEIISEKLTVRIEGVLYPMGVNYTITITNNTKYVMTLDGANQFLLRYASVEDMFSGGETAEEAACKRDLGTIVINPQSTKTITGAFTQLAQSMRERPLKMWLLLDGSKKYSQLVGQVINPDNPNGTI